MSEVTYPIGYGTQRVTMAELRRRFEPHMHPAMARRLFPWLEHKAGLVGIKGAPGCGGGRRLQQPIKPGFAPPGKSFHQDQLFASGIVAYSAWDLVVGVPGRVHRSPTWAETVDAPKFGLHTFISGEPWHIQCLEMRGHGSWVNAGRPDPAMDFPVPGVDAPPPPPPAELPPGSADYNPPTNWWIFPLNTNKPTIRSGSKDGAFIGHVRYLQDVIHFGAGGNIGRDGDFGPQTEGRVKDLQRVFELTVDGVVGPQTWSAVDTIVSRILKPEDEGTPPANGVEQVSPVSYYVRAGDSPWGVGERVYGSGAAGAELLDASSFSAPHHHIEIPNIKGLRTEVQPGEGPYNVLGRMNLPGADLDVFYTYNGGEGRTLHPGDVIFMPVDP